MKAFAFLGGLLLATSAIAQDGGPFRAALTGYEEVPAVDTAASGTFEARLNATGGIDYTLTYSGLQAAVTQAHIHFAQKGVNGSVLVWLCQTGTNSAPFATVPQCLAEGTVTGTFTADNILASSATQQFRARDMQSLLDAIIAGVAYVNVHTAVSTAGEIRGQIRRGG